MDSLEKWIGRRLVRTMSDLDGKFYTSADIRRFTYLDPIVFVV